ncbi:1507_t:CDS:2, partial [Entrophospora sp. SA101]
CQNLLVLNIDDYHNLHQSRLPSTTSISQISHMATLLINKIDAPTIPISSSNIHNPNGVEAGLLKNLLRMNFNNIVCESYNQNKMKWIFHSIIPVPADFPGQLYIRRSIIQKLKLNELSPIPSIYPVENFHSLVRRHTSAKVLVPEWLRRDGIFIDYQRHDNDFTQNFRVKKTYPYSKQNIDTMVKSGAIFLLKLFDNFSKNSGKFEVKREGKKIKKPYWYFSGISKGFPGGALPLGHHSNQSPEPNHFCDASECENPFLISGSVKLCGHAYHDDCWNKLNCICVYCHNYLSDSIDELSKSYNKRLEMDNDTQDELELPNDDLLEEESNNVDAVPAYEELNQKLNKMLM